MMKKEELFLDENHDVADPSEARWLVVHEYDEDDNLVRETWVDLKKR